MNEQQPNTQRPVAARTHPEYIKYTILTVLIPILGIGFGIIYSVRNDPQDKKLGEHLLAFGILLSILYSVLYMLVGPNYLVGL